MNTTLLFKMIKTVDKAYIKLCEPILQEFNMPQVSFDILMFLSNNPDCCTAKEISEKRNIKPNVVSMYVEKLVNDGYLSRQSFDGDRRKIKLVCTCEAEAVIDKGLKMQGEFLDRLYFGISQKELENLRTSIKNITLNAENIALKSKSGGLN